jgi:hypothetical protein
MGGVKRGYESKGGAVEGERFFDFNGLPTCDLTASAEHNGNHIKTKMRMLIANGQVYQMQAIQKSSEPLGKDVQNFLDSFRFLNRSAGAIGAASPVAGQTSTRESANSVAYLIGYLFGFVAVGVFMIGAVVFIIVLIVKSSSSQRPPPIRPPNFS